MKKFSEVQNAVERAYGLAAESKGGTCSCSYAVKFALKELVPRGYNKNSIRRYIYTLLARGNQTFEESKAKTKHKHIVLKKKGKGLVDLCREPTPVTQSKEKVVKIVTVVTTITTTTVVEE